MDNLWVLEGKTPVKAKDTESWGKFFSSKTRVVAQTRIGRAKISTVFLAIDHGFGMGLPILFETMVFGGTLDGSQDRCTTYDEAESLHKRICANVMSIRTSEVLVEWNRRVSARERKVNESVTFEQRTIRVRKKER